MQKRTGNVNCVLNSNENAVTDGWKLLLALWYVLHSMGVFGCVWTQVNNNHGLDFHLVIWISYWVQKSVPYYDHINKVPIRHGMNMSDILYWSHPNCTLFTTTVLKFYCLWPESGLLYHINTTNSYCSDFTFSLSLSLSHSALSLLLSISLLVSRPFSSALSNLALAPILFEQFFSIYFSSLVFLTSSL